MKYEDVTPIFKALAHPIRIQILDMLRIGELCVCHIENALNKRQAYISQQLMTLRETGLVASRKEGLQVHYRIADDRVMEILEVVLGKPTSSQPDVLENCACPSCTVVFIENEA